MKIVAVDFGAVWWTAWHASADQDISEAYHRTLRRVHEAARMGDCVAICLDSPKSRRKERWPGYKADRERKPEGAIAQMHRAIDQLRELGLCTIEVDYAEGDDVVGMLTVWASDNGHDVVIYGADKDLYQLLRQDRVEIVNHQTGEVFAESDLLTKAGIKPHQVPDFLALVGDKADGLPGVQKCGAKKAALLLGEFGSIDGIYDALHNRVTSVSGLPGIGPTLIANLLAAEEREPDIRLVRSLATLWVEGEPGQRLAFDGVLSSQFPEDHSIEEGDANVSQDNHAPSHDTVPVFDAELEQVVRSSTTEPEQPANHRTASLAQRDVSYERQLEPTTINGAYRLAETLFKSGFFRVRNPEGVFTLILAGRSYGLDVVQSIQGVHLIDGKPSLSAGLMHALCLRHPDCEYFQLVESSAEVAVFETRRRGAPAPVRMSWTIDEARSAGLVGKDNWKKYPKAMLRARCIAELSRAVYPDAVHNTYLLDELGQDVAEDAAQ